MTLPLPKATLTVRKGGLGVAQSGPTNVHVAIGCSSKGPFGQALAFNVPTGASSATGTYGCGPMPKAAAYATRKANARYIAIRVAATAVSASTSAITKPTGKTVAVTDTAGAVQWGYDVSIVFTTGGTVGVAGIFYKTSVNGGATYTTPAALGTATVIVVGGKDVTLTGAEVYADADEIRFYTLPASQARGPVTTTRIGSSTSVITITGTPEDEYEWVFEVLTGCTIGVTGGVFRYSLDGGNTWSPATQLSTANSFALLDGTEASGLTLNFAAGTLDAGDVARGETTGPVPQASDVLAALDVLRASAHDWRFLHVAGDMTAAKVGSIGGKCDTFEGAGIFTYAVMSARDRTLGEIGTDGAPSVAWRERLIADFANVAGDRIAVSAGRARVTCPITGRSNRRPTSWITTARLVEKTIQVDPGRKLDGALSSDVNIYDSTGRLVELDSRVADSLHGARFLTLRTYERDPGTYVTRGNLMSGPSSDFSRIAHRAVMDVASEIFEAVMLQQLENNLLANPLTGPQPDGANATPGALAELDARIIDRELLSALTNVLVTAGYVSGVRARVSRTDPFLTTGTLTAEVSITPLGYVDNFNGGIAFENPKFAALTA